MCEDVHLLDNNESATKELHLYLNFTRCHEFVLPDGRFGKGYDTVAKVWHHLHFFQHISKSDGYSEKAGA